MDYDLIVSGSGPGGEEVAGSARRGRAVGARGRRAAGRRRVPVLRLHPVEDDRCAAPTCSARRGRVDQLAGHADRHARLRTGRRPHPRRGHRRLGRHGRGRAVRGPGRHLRPRHRPARRPRRRRAGFRVEAGGRDAHRSARRGGHRHRAGDPADRRPGRPAARRRRAGLDEPRDPADPHRAGVAGRDRRRRDRLRAGAGHRPVRHPGDDHRGGAAPAHAARSRRRARWWPTVFEREGITVHQGVGVSRSRAAGTGSVVDARRRQHRDRREACWSRPAARPNLVDIGLDTRRPRPDGAARSTSTSTCRSCTTTRRSTGCTRSATSPAAAPFTHVAVWQARRAHRAPARPRRALRRLPRTGLGHVHRPRGRAGSG